MSAVEAVPKKKSKGTDLSQFDTITASNKGAVMVVINPRDGEPLDDGAVKITLAGPDSDQYRKADRELTDEAKRTRSISKYASEAADLHRLAKCTLAWEGPNGPNTFLFSGEDLPCNYDNARKVYGALPWLRKQAAAFLGDYANFLQS